MGMEEIVQKGFAEARIRVGGILQLHRFILEKEKSAFGFIPILVLKTASTAPAAELLKVANQFQLPVKSKDFIVFPEGKSAKDFAQSQK